MNITAEHWGPWQAVMGSWFQYSTLAELTALAANGQTQPIIPTMYLQ